MMIRAFRTTVILSAVAVCMPLVAVGQTLQFTLPDSAEQQFELAPGDFKFAAVCFLGTECPMARVYAGRLNELHDEFQQNGGQLIAVMSNRQDSLEDIKRYQSNLSLTFPVLVDRGNVVADQFGATRTPEVFLLDSGLKLRYHGRIDDQYAPGVAKARANREDLRIAVQEMVAGKPVSVKKTRALGCIIGREKRTAEVETSTGITFYKDILPVLQNHCIECHRKGEIGPFAMNNYDEVVGWADTMMETIDDGRMPPWHADPEHGKFKNQRHMSTDDKELLRSWIEAGAPEGNVAESPAPQSYVTGWGLPEEPDFVIPMRNRPFVVPSDGVVEYQYFVVNPGFKEDKWIKAAEVIPGNRAVVHHAIVFVRPPDGVRFQGIGWLSAYVPGQRAVTLPPGRAKLIPAGSRLVFQMHYTPNGTEQKDTTKIGLLLADENEEITHSVYTLAALDQEFEIPPHATDHEVKAKLTRFPTAGELMAVTPHMHFRGKSFRLNAEHSAADDQETLLNVPNYDFNWQHTYYLEQPLDLVDISSINFRAHFDNSEGNPFNPNPDEWVSWGDQTWEEMAVAFFEISEPRKKSKSKRTANNSLDRGSENNEDMIQKYIARVLKAMDADQDGQIRKGEADIIVSRWNFWRWDANRDDVISQQEIRAVAEKLYR